MAPRERKLALGGHLDELRRRLGIGLAAVAVCTAAVYVFRNPILSYLARPLGKPLVFLSPGEAFIAQLELALAVGVMLASPVILLQVWLFVRTALQMRERRFVFRYAAASLVLFTAGIAVGWFLFVPLALRVLLAFGGEAALPLISLQSYLSFVLVVLLGFGAFFEVPIIVAAFVKLGIVELETLRRLRREIIVAILILAALVTPTADPLSFLLLALPIIVLFEGTLFFLRRR